VSYGYVTWLQLENALLQRLQDNSASYTSRAEAAIYITEALRIMNAVTAAGTSGQWAQEYQLDFAPGDQWKYVDVPGSPRARTVRDSDIQTQMEYMLLEPPTGLVWTGTAQFNTTSLSQALNFRRDELLLLTGANPVRKIINSPTNAYRTTLSDSTLDVRRVRWIPDSTMTALKPYALGRGDVISGDAYGDLLSIQPGAPDEWRIIGNSPLAFDVSCPINMPGQWDMILLYSEDAFIPPTPSNIGLPDDWAWVAMYGALADVLSQSPEATDLLRAKYCAQRYELGKQSMMALPWLLRAQVASLPVGTPSFTEMDAYAQNWEQSWPSGDPQIVVGGMDLVALAPFATGSTVSTVLTVVGNAPVDQTQPVQLSRDAVDQVLNYAQHLAAFKMGGAEFLATIPLYQQFEAWCGLQNKRFASLGIFRPEMLTEGNRADDVDPRFGAQGGASS
jgi:hypothetical protein